MTFHHLEYKVSKVVQSSDAAESHDKGKTKSSLHLEYVVSKVVTCYICKSKYDTNEKQHKHVNENHKDVVKGEVFVCKYCGNNSSNLKAYKKECKQGTVNKLPLMVYECDGCKHKISNRFNLYQHIASSLCCRTRIESSMASDKNAKKTDNVSDSSESATEHNNGTDKQKSTFGRAAKTEKVKEHSQCHPNVQSTELVKQSKARNKHIESGKQSSQSESLCDRPENEQDNADLQATTKGDKSHHSTTQL